MEVSVSPEDSREAKGASENGETCMRAEGDREHACVLRVWRLYPEHERKGCFQGGGSPLFLRSEERRKNGSIYREIPKQ